MKMTEYIIEQVETSKIKLDEANPNKMTEKQKTGLSQSLDIHGLLKPLIIDQNNMLIDGHQRLEQILKKQWKTIPCHRIKIKNISERKQIQLITNRMHGKDDLLLLAKNYDILLNNKKLDQTALILDRPKEEMELLIEKQLEKIIDKLPLKEPKSITPNSKLGQIYQLANHRIMVGDANNPEHVKKLLNNKLPNLLFTDPPYDLNQYEYLDYLINTAEIEIFVIHDDKGHRDIINQYGEYLVENHIITFNSPINYGNQAMMDHRMLIHLRKGKSKFQNLKDAFGTTHRTILNRTGIVKHAKDLRIPKDFITHYSTEGDLILDLFAGSGTTLFAAQLTNRICYSMEIDPLLVDEIIKDWNRKYDIEPKLI